MNNIKHFFISRYHSFGHAFRGWGYALKTQRNAWIHATATVLILILAFWLKLTLRDIAILLVTIALVWTAEFINTALEAVVDLASPQSHPLAKVGKDVGAASVLIAAITSILVGILILLNPLLEKVRPWFTK